MTFIWLASRGSEYFSRKIGYTGVGVRVAELSSIEFTCVIFCGHVLAHAGECRLRPSDTRIYAEDGDQ